MKAVGEVAVVFELKPSHTDEFPAQNSCVREREEASDEGGDGDGVDVWPSLCTASDRSSTMPSQCRQREMQNRAAATRARNPSLNPIEFAQLALITGPLAWIEVGGL